MRGRITAVKEVSLGSALEVAAVDTDTTLTVATTADFDWIQGGSLTIGEETFGYTVVDGTTLQLDGALTADYAEDEPVTIDPPVVERWASVQAEDQEEEVQARVPHHLYGYLTPDLRTTDQGEVVNIIPDENGEMFVLDILGLEPTFDGAIIPPDTLPPPAPSDGDPPPSSPTVTLTPGPGYLVAAWPLIANDDFTTYEVHVDTFTGFTPTSGTLVGETAASGWVVTETGAGATLVPDTEYFVRIVAKDADGSAAAGTEDSAEIILIDIPFIEPIDFTDIDGELDGLTQLAADSVNAAALAASAVGSSELAAGSVIAGKIGALAIVAADIAADTITGAKIAATTIAAGEMVANTLTANEIAANAITASELAANSITAADMLANTITAGQIAATTITAAQIVAGTITANELAAGSVTATKLEAELVLSTEIKTALTGTRLELDGNGMRLYDSTGLETVNLNTTTGRVTARGNFVFGATLESEMRSDDVLQLQEFGGAGSVQTPNIVQSTSSGTIVSAPDTEIAGQFYQQTKPGNFILAFVWCNSANTPTTPSGWSVLASGFAVASDGNSRLIAYRRTSASVIPKFTTTTWDWGAITPHQCGVNMIEVSGVTPADVDVAVVQAVNTDPTTLTTSGAPSQASQFVIGAVAGYYNGAGSSMADPSGYEMILDNDILAIWKSFWKVGGAVSVDHTATLDFTSLPSEMCGMLLGFNAKPAGDPDAPAGEELIAYVKDDATYGAFLKLRSSGYNSSVVEALLDNKTMMTHGVALITTSNASPSATSAAIAHGIPGNPNIVATVDTGGTSTGTSRFIATCAVANPNFTISIRTNNDSNMTNGQCIVRWIAFKTGA